MLPESDYFVISTGYRASYRINVADVCGAFLGPRFPVAWWRERHECFVAKDSNGQKLAYVYFEDEAGRRAAAKVLSYDEARRGASRRTSPSCPNCRRANGKAVCVRAHRTEGNPFL